MSNHLRRKITFEITQPCCSNGNDSGFTLKDWNQYLIDNTFSAYQTESIKAPNSNGIKM